MRLFTVTVREIHDQYVDVRAENKAEAILRVAKGEGALNSSTEYNRTLPVDQWDVLEVDEE